MDLLLFIFISIGCSHLWSFSKVFSPIRNKIADYPLIRSPFICPECSSFWIGLFISFFINPCNGYIYSYISNIGCGVICYVFCVFLYKKGVLN